MITRTCRVSGKKFEITADDLDFYAKMEIISAEDCEKVKTNPPSSLSQRGENIVGLPTLCPEERCRRRMSIRNFNKLYSRQCDGAGKNIVSMYNDNHQFPVYKNDYWWGDK
jgi:hypothetical protein